MRKPRDFPTANELLTALDREDARLKGTLMDRRTQKPFYSCIERRPEPRRENLLLGFLMACMIAGAILFIWGASR